MAWAALVVHEDIDHRQSRLRGPIGRASVARPRFPEAMLMGLDTGYFAHVVTATGRAPESLLDVQYYADIRDIPGTMILTASTPSCISPRFQTIRWGTPTKTVTLAVNYHAGVEFAAPGEGRRRAFVRVCVQLQRLR